MHDYSPDRQTASHRPNESRTGVAFRLKTADFEKDQGKVFDATLRHKASNHFMPTGRHIRFANWRFVHRARLDMLPLNRTRRWGDGDRQILNGDLKLISDNINTLF